jgi:hypothetical protein
MRETAQELTNILAAEVRDEPSPRTGIIESWRHEIEQYFTDTPIKSARKRRSARAMNQSSSNVESLPPPPTEQPATIPHADVAPDLVQASAESFRPSPDQIDWDIPTEGNWDQVIADAGGTFEGIGLEEARNRGLYTPPPPDINAKEDLDRPSVDDIDWDISTDLDWDGLVANTDQGFAGMDFEEAKKRGLINDPETD